MTATDARGTKLRIRLLGIDAPEIGHGDKPGQPYGEEARQYLDSLIGGKIVQVEAHGPDQYKRVLAVLFDRTSTVEPDGGPRYGSKGGAYSALGGP